MIKVLCAADLHIGRRSSRLPDHVRDRAISCAAGWDAVVDRAIRERVDALVLAGDVVDRENRFFEAFGPLERGLRRLAEAGIETVAVAGNHDYDVLPRLADDVGAERFHLLGRGGRWERHTLETRAGSLHVDGWSFPAEHVRTSPLDGHDLPDPGATPVLGLLHADLDQADSTYAPVKRSRLRQRPAAAWVLGHIHQPAVHRTDGAAPVLYPGSPQAMDPGEPGAHGAVLLEIGAGRAVSATPVPLSSVWYDTVEVDASGAEALEDIDRNVVSAVRGTLEAAAGAGGPLRFLSCRVRVVGRTELPLHALEQRLERQVRADELVLHRGDATAFVERVSVDARPAIDLEARARGDDPAAELARLVRALDTGETGPYDEVIHAARRKIAEVDGAAPYRALHADDAAGPAGRTDRALHHVERQAMRLLETLLEQKEGGRV